MKTLNKALLAPITRELTIPRFKNIGRNIIKQLNQDHPDYNFITNSIDTSIDKVNNNYKVKINYCLTRKSNHHEN